MHALEVRRNDQLLAVVGAEAAVMFSAGISVSIEDECATLDIRGMNDLAADRTSHTSWVDLEDLTRGDRLRFKFIESESATPPATEVASDSEQHVAGQKAYAEQIEEDPLQARPMTIRSPHATVLLITEDGARHLARLESGREFISFHLLWNKWRPDQCRVSLRSFSQKEALERAGAREWFQGTLQLGQHCEVKVDA